MFKKIYFFFHKVKKYRDKKWYRILGFVIFLVLTAVSFGSLFIIEEAYRAVPPEARDTGTELRNIIAVIIYVAAGMAGIYFSVKVLLETVLIKDYGAMTVGTDMRGRKLINGKLIAASSEEYKEKYKENFMKIVRDFHDRTIRTVTHPYFIMQLFRELGIADDDPKMLYMNEAKTKEPSVKEELTVHNDKYGVTVTIKYKTRKRNNMYILKHQETWEDFIDAYHRKYTFFDVVIRFDKEGKA